jgi:transcriptional regulator with XRE-family HTH domain
MGLSQVDFGEHLGVNQTTVSRWERGLEHPGLRARLKLSELLYRLDSPKSLNPEIALCRYSPFPMAIISQDWTIIALSETLQETAQESLRSTIGGKKLGTAETEQAVSILSARGFFEGKIGAAKILARGFLLGRDPKPFAALCTPIAIEGQICRLMQYVFLSELEFRTRRANGKLVAFLGEKQDEDGG